jgi:hypothetical protein
MPALTGVLILLGALALAAGSPSSAQQPAQPAPATQPAPDAAQQQPAPAPATDSQAPATAPEATQATPAQAPAPSPAQPAKPAAAPSNAPAAPQAAAMTEEELKQMLVGKSLYLRGGYLENSISFDEVGRVVGNPTKGSYTLSGVEIDKVHLTRHKVELEGARYGLHFLGALPFEDPTKAVDRVKITPKKKFLKITIDRELVVAPKKVKPEKPDRKQKQPGSQAAGGKAGDLGPPPNPNATPGQPAAAQAATTAEGAAPAAGPPDAGPPTEDQAKAEMASAPVEERPADPGSVTTTTSQAHANKVLKDALDKIFAFGLDDRVMASMPDFWKLYYEAVANKTDYRPKDPAILRQNAVDQKAKLLSKFEPESNDFAQASGVAGMALYHTVIGADGKPGEIAVARPIGFGLDENAVAAIRKATFQPAVKSGQPVPVMLDLVVQFRIYSKRTAVAGKPDEADKPAEAVLPGPYSVKRD